MIEHNVDTLLSLIARISWVLFLIYAATIFINTLLTQGFAVALVRIFAFRVLIPLVLVIGLSLLSLALVFIEPTQVGVVVSATSPSGIRPQPLRSGLHWIVPIAEREVRYPVYWQTYTMSSKPVEGTEVGDDSVYARTNDGQEVRLDCSVIFRVDLEQAVSLHIDWQGRYIEDFVRPLVRGLIRTDVSRFDVDEVNSSKRQDLESGLQQELQSRFASKGLILDQFLVRNISFSPEYAASIESKQVAFEGQQQSEYQATQLKNLAKGRAEAIKIEADAQAAALMAIGEALEKNKDLLTYRYIEKLSPNIRVMLVPNDAPFILPLPDLGGMEPITATGISTSTVISNPVSGAGVMPSSVLDSVSESNIGPIFGPLSESILSPTWNPISKQP